MSTRKHCTCRYLDHEPLDCLYPNGCDHCCCHVAAHTPATFCEPCQEYTVHPDQHEHGSSQR